MAEVSTFLRRWVWAASLGFLGSAVVSCSQEPTLPRVLSDAERPTPLEIARAPEVGVCELNARTMDYVDELVRVRGRWVLAFGVNRLEAPGCEGLNIAFDEARMKRLSSSKALLSLDEWIDPRLEGTPVYYRRRSFDVVFVGRFRQTRAWPDPPSPTSGRRLLLYSVESVTPLASRQP